MSAWSAGCSDGSELYSLGVVLERLGALDRALLLGSDLLRRTSCWRGRGRSRASRTLRTRVRWERRNLVADGPPPGRWRLVLCRNVAIYMQPAARARLYATLVSALARRGVLLLGRSERLIDPAASGCARSGRMPMSGWWHDQPHGLGSLVLLAVVTLVIGLLTWAIARQREAAVRALESQKVIAAANLTQQRLLSVQTNVRGYLIRGNDDVLQEYRQARAALPDATLDLLAMVEGDPAQTRRAEGIRAEALSYVDDYGDAVIARTREDGVIAGRAFASADDGSRVRQVLAGRIAALAEDRAAQSARGRRRCRRGHAPRDLVAVVGLAACFVALAFVTGVVARRIARPVGRVAAAAARVRRGELDATVPRGPRRSRALGATFNAMARSLEE